VKVPKDVLAIAAVVVAGLGALWVARSPRSAATETPESPHVREAQVFEVTYRVEGGQSGMRFVEVRVEGPGHARVRYQPEGGAVSAVPVAWTEEDHVRLLRLLADVHFFETDEVGRRGYYPDMAKTTLQAKLGELWNEIVIDGRTRPSHDLSQLVAVLDRLRLSATPELLIQGD